MKTIQISDASTEKGECTKIVYFVPVNVDLFLKKPLVCFDQRVAETRSHWFLAIFVCVCVCVWGKWSNPIFVRVFLGSF